MTKLLGRKWTSYVLAVFGVAVVTAVLAPLNQDINATTVGFAFLLFVFVQRGFSLRSHTNLVPVL
jgi:hypothetical protein